MTAATTSAAVMDTLIFLLLLSAPIALADNQQKPKDPNDEPFLPIFPVYPYSPKLLKRGTESGETSASQLSAELYAPKVDARNFYSASYQTDYQRNPYYVSYNSYPKTGQQVSYQVSSSYPTTAGTQLSSETSSSYSPLGNVVSPYNYSPLPYASYGSSNPSYVHVTPSLYPASVYSALHSSTSAPPSASSFASSTSPSSSTSYSVYSPSPYTAPPYSAYYYQPSYYPGYYNHALFPPPPPVLPPKSDYPDSSSEEANAKKQTAGRFNKEKESNVNQENEDSRYTDGSNYISYNEKDLDSESSTYKLSNPYNKPEQSNNEQLKDFEEIRLPKGTYRIINMSAKSSNEDSNYPVTTAHLKTQQLEQLMKQTLAKILAQSMVRPVVRYPVYKTNHNTLKNAIDSVSSSYNSNDNDNENAYYGNKSVQRYAKIANGDLAKSSLRPFVINADGESNSNGNSNVVGSMKSSEYSQTLAALSRNNNKYSSGDEYEQKPMSRIIVQPSAGVYIAPARTANSPISSQSSSYDDYEVASSQMNESYKSAVDDDKGDKEVENYESERSQPATASYQRQNFVTLQTPQAYNHQYTYYPTQVTMQEHSQQYDETADDMNFGEKKKQ